MRLRNTTRSLMMRNFFCLKRWDGLGGDVTRYVAKAEVKVVWYFVERDFTYWLG